MFKQFEKLLKMPGKSKSNTVHTISKITKHRLEANKRVVDAALVDDLEDCTFGRVTKMLGGARVQVILPDQTEAQGQIRGLFRKKGATPIRVNDILILSARDFGTKTGTLPVYDVIGICDRKEALELSNSSKIPKWFVTSEVKKTTEGKVDIEENEEGLYDFDEEAPLEMEEEEKSYKVDKKDKKDHFAVSKDSVEIDIDNI